MNNIPKFILQGKFKNINIIILKIMRKIYNGNKYAYGNLRKTT